MRGSGYSSSRASRSSAEKEGMSFWKKERNSALVEACCGAKVVPS